MSAAPAAAKAGVRRLVDSRLKVSQRDLLTRRNGRISFFRSSTTVEYGNAYLKANVKPTEANPNHYDCQTHPRLIDAEILHGDEQAFWRQKRAFYRRDQSFMPSWDRQAHALVLLTRSVARAPQAAAFRLFALYLKLLLLPRLVMERELLLPLLSLANTEGILGQAIAEVEKNKDNNKADNKDGGSSDSRSEKVEEKKANEESDKKE